MVVEWRELTSEPPFQQQPTSTSHFHCRLQPFSMGRISGSGDKYLTYCRRARLWSATRVLAVCIRVETFDFRGETSCAKSHALVKIYK